MGLETDNLYVHHTSVTQIIEVPACPPV